MDTNNVAFKFSPYLLPIVVQELLSNIDSTLHIFFYKAHNLGRLLGITDDFETIPFHLVLFSAALVELAKFIPVHPLILSFHLFFSLSLLLFPFIVFCRIVFAKLEDLQASQNHLHVCVLKRLLGSFCKHGPCKKCSKLFDSISKA